MSRILLADDDVMQLDLRKLVLESAGHEVAVAFSPRQALRKLERWAPELVIVDLCFINAAGDQDAAEGLALIRGIREQGCQAPVMVLSGWPDELYGQPEERMVSRVMLKPVDSEDLIEAVAALA
jgi:two-component system NtrC family response regulator